MKGYHVYTDNLFTSIPLAKHLYSAGTYITGTIRRNRKGLSDSLKHQFNSVMNKYFRQGPLLLVGSKQKKSQKNQVIVLSTCASATESDVKPTARNRNEPQKKHDVILDYNRYMGGIDGNDMMTYFYLDERRTVKFWKKVAFNMIVRMVLNAYLLYLENNNGGKNYYTAILFVYNRDYKK